MFASPCSAGGRRDGPPCGRKSGHPIWLFAGSDAGGTRAAAIASLIATARLNGLDPEAYLRPENGACDPSMERQTVNMATRDSPGATPGLRFDKVALRLVQGVRGALEGAVPDGLCVVFAVTAPIREPSKRWPR